jgi:hypothetical protein
MFALCCIRDQQRRPETVEHRKIDPVEHALRGTGDKFMCQGELEETVKGTVWNAILTDQAFIKVESDGSIRQRKELIDIHSVVVDPADRRAFFMYSYKSAAALQADKMKGVFGFGMKFDSFLQERRFVCATADLCFQWTLVINRLVSDAWQRIFESKMIHDPEIYQGHAFVIKLNSKGVAQERTVVLSTEWIYNVDIQHSPTGIKELKVCSSFQLWNSHSLVIMCIFEYNCSGRFLLLLSNRWFSAPITISRVPPSNSNPPWSRR